MRRRPALVQLVGPTHAFRREQPYCRRNRRQICYPRLATAWWFTIALHDVQYRLLYVYSGLHLVIGRDRLCQKQRS